ncbi:MAG: glycosyltransferase family 2 protein [Myxococcaceae bacterium]|nr:glycosyltransferase family 2 protein [Myxococcaceae bacterium]
MNLVIPMAGRGSRFAQVGVTVPKPLIDVRGKPMYAWATDSLPLAHAKRLVFICLAEHLSDLALEEDIHRRYGQYHPVVVGLNEVTQGQACTVLTAKKHLDEDVPLVIFNADTFFTSALSKTVATLPPQVRGLLGVFKAPGDKWSFARTDAQGRVVEVAEKKRISGWACTGLYHFSSGAEFVQHAEEMIADDERVNNEFYVAPVYNRLLAQGSELRLDVAEQVWVLGTPEDLAHFEAHYPRR